MLAAFEATLRQGAKDAATWKNIEREFYQPPKEILMAERKARRQGAVPATPDGRGNMSVSAAESLVARLAAADTRYGA